MRVLVDSFADSGLLNAQMGNAREIVRRLDPTQFHVSMFLAGKPHPSLSERANIRFIRLPKRGQTINILREFCWGDHDLVFYLKSSPASRWYMAFRKKWGDARPIIGTMESQSDLRNEPTISPTAIRLWEHTVLRCDYLFSNSRSVQNSLHREYGLKSQIIPTGVDTKFFLPAKHRQANVRPRVLFVGSLRPFKQPQLLLDAAKQFPEADFRIVGDGPLRPELQSEIAQKRLSNVVLAGSVDAEQLRDEYRAADVFLFPSNWEGSPKVILEAAACGLPAIVHSSYAPETVQHGVTGYQADTNEQVFEFLAALLASHELCQKLGANARNLSLRYDWDIIAGQWAEVLTNLAIPAARKAS